MAVARAHRDDYFPHFIFHDGVFESLDNRKKINLLNIIRRYSSEYNLQHIITLIDSDLPAEKNDHNIFYDGEIILFLHDKDEKGRLFKMKPW
jgi:uncharacterized protein YydD (DUF2326 family)